MADPTTTRAPTGATGVLVLASGEVIWGRGFGAEGSAVGEVCFNTAMTGYQEVMTDPSYAGQIISFTFPHIGNVGTNLEDIEAINPHALGAIVRQDVTNPSSFRATQHFRDWMAANGRIGLSGVDTRALTRLIRLKGAPNAVIAHSANGTFDIPALLAQAKAWPGLEGMDLAKDVTTLQSYGWDEGLWKLGQGYAKSPLPLTGGARGGQSSPSTQPTPDLSRKREGRKPKVVAIDYGIKRNILRNLVDTGCEVTVVPATASFEDIMAHQPDGLFLSNGPGDPAATGEYAVPVIRQWLETKKPLFGICLGHQMLALAVGAKTEKMHQGHRGANHPVKRLSDGAVEITSMNHGFAVNVETLPANARATHTSLFDGSNCGFELTDQPAFAVQYHPEASPGPQDSHYLFEKFAGMMG
ncbi:MAG: glutamine-hydrolyzing carbamoyl-phosphate synthase small subunit [Sphingomonadales bacterium]|jgi:carbamoyl-phosphate synthase small subunit|nr:glutamine-hydrolyzing carbamoyl-phosphate synthase small subunit [Sphingomonadales bacterium]MBK9268870.1 glutamine-hydrolyzing carbamoyl-phosphate synthase small subunit [Sphingomonadales bacterium]MBP6434789.1 glutamine-hydrolyzing carbamoyl-phosphate synthase small subunit [Sphingorhabdus sp.]